MIQKDEVIEALNMVCKCTTEVKKYGAISLAAELLGVSDDTICEMMEDAEDGR